MRDKWHGRLDDHGPERSGDSAASVATVPSPSGRAEMGYPAQMRFEPGELALLAEAEEIEIETAMPGGPAHRTIIWVVVDGDDAFLRSVNGATARWYREAIANPEVTIHAGRRELRARALPATDPESIRRTSDALATKYVGFEGTQPMLEPAILDTTLRLTPG
jgi:hypothetical protein